MARVDIGFFPDFKSRDTLLIDGDREGLRLLAITLRNLTNTSGSTSIHELPFAKTHHDIRIVARLSERDEGASIHGVDVTWQRSADGWLETAEKLDVLETAGSAHQYLDALHDRITAWHRSASTVSAGGCRTVNEL